MVTIFTETRLIVGNTLLIFPYPLCFVERLENLGSSGDSHGSSTLSTLEIFGVVQGVLRGEAGRRG